ncbi:MAG: cell division protein ZapA [Pseudomonadota bacterium]|nr:cell division protein ZapA [Pseudomonadota bacterium]
MADVDIVINSRTYRVSCKDGEEDRIIFLSSQINQEVELLASRIGQLGEARMILLAALVLLDKSDENQDKMEEILKNTSEKIESVVNSINAERKK